MIKCRLILQTDRYYSITKFLLETSILIYPYDQDASTLTSPNITTCTPVKLLVIDADIIKALLIDTILTSHTKNKCQPERTRVSSRHFIVLYTKVDKQVNNLTCFDYTSRVYALQYIYL